MLRVPCSFYKTVRNENITVTNIFHYPTKRECRYPDNSYFAIFAGNHHTSKMILLSCAKTMSRPPLKEGKKGTDPLFGKEAHEIALAFAQCTPDELRRLLHLPPKLANENFHRYQNFHSTDTVVQPALKAYTGIVFKTLNPNDFTEAEIAYAQERLRITSFVYGLLRPLDKIKPYQISLYPNGEISPFSITGDRNSPLISCKKSKHAEGYYSTWPATKCVVFSTGKPSKRKPVSSRPNSKYDTTTAGKQSSSTPKWLAAHLPVTC